jgi:hypothetical protein
MFDAAARLLDAGGKFSLKGPANLIGGSAAGGESWYSLPSPFYPTGESREANIPDTVNLHLKTLNFWRPVRPCFMLEASMFLLDSWLSSRVAHSEVP